MGFGRAMKSEGTNIPATWCNIDFVFVTLLLIVLFTNWTVSTQLMSVKQQTCISIPVHHPLFNDLLVMVVGTVISRTSRVRQNITKSFDCVWYSR